ncbi:hypothetical protein Pelo_4638 [Pelomyxa schiedti]|nr:hypothetical protein Pelo_4638 [Pelomyxa schiedti]
MKLLKSATPRIEITLIIGAKPLECGLTEANFRTHFRLLSVQSDLHLCTHPPERRGNSHVAAHDCKACCPIPVGIFPPPSFLLLRLDLYPDTSSLTGWLAEQRSITTCSFRTVHRCFVGHLTEKVL